MYSNKTNSDTLGVGVVGYGYWGPNLVRNFNELDGTHVVTVCDMNIARLKQVQAKYPGMEVTADYAAMLADHRVQVVCVATPVRSHFALAKAALLAGKHVFVEKPMAETGTQAEELIELAERQRRVLMVDHTFIYTGAVRKMRELVETGELGDVYYYDSVRVNLGLFQHDVNVIWDLAIHDLAVMEYVLGQAPKAVSATGISHLRGQPENIAYLTMFFEGSLIAHMHVNWLAPVKIRRTLLGGSRKMVVYDDLEPSEKIKIYDKGASVAESPEAIRQMLVSYRTGDAWLPKLDATEALTAEARHFRDCIREGRQPLSDGRAGLRTVRILEAASQSLKLRGQPVELP
ncbi:MAG: gfo/Idh/MocA family oxidoreductase [Verrucomicrobia bacterium]|nr:gfo/Idh/MocA family oxidoreductase [Verrucomicrobiota bacterium]NBU11251.1 gfo/Idh/MocA family oxidoreductase [Pseudomonadota bacterium]NDA65072.1 gfo/Idh/MocA family oxidoreductase [Verrucomicrobiota bacterium]NDE98947.1 gfo/Idh/MocA family oxidoreductase [Verrucomicrobiota bacterium]